MATPKFNELRADSPSYSKQLTDQNGAVVGKQFAEWIRRIKGALTELVVNAKDGQPVDTSSRFTQDQTQVSQTQNTTGENQDVNHSSFNDFLALLTKIRKTLASIFADYMQSLTSMVSTLKEQLATNGIDAEKAERVSQLAHKALANMAQRESDIYDNLLAAAATRDTDVLDAQAAEIYETARQYDEENSEEDKARTEQYISPLALDTFGGTVAAAAAMQTTRDIRELDDEIIGVDDYTRQIVLEAIHARQQYLHEQLNERLQQFLAQLPAEQQHELSNLINTSSFYQKHDSKRGLGISYGTPLVEDVTILKFTPTK